MGFRAQFEPVAVAAALKYGLDPKVFVAQINQESGFNPNARSGVGALGIAQFMPDTAKGLKVNPLDPHAALDAAAKHMASLAKTYGGIQYALAAYNGGGDAVHHFKTNNPNFTPNNNLPANAWDRQTANYVRSIMAAAGHQGGTGQPSQGKKSLASEPHNNPATEHQEVISLVDGEPMET